MKKFKNPTTLNLEIPKPKICRISPLALFFIIGLIIVLFAVAIFSLQSHQSRTPQNAMGTQSQTVASSDDRSWYQNKSNAVISKPKNLGDQKNTPPDLGRTIPNANNDDQQALKKMKNAAYLQAINSSLTPMGLTESQAQSVSTTSGTTQATNGEQLDPSLRKLPLSDDQIARLDKAFNLGGLSDQNLQGEKQAFLDTRLKKTDKDYLNENLKNPVSPYEVQAGTIIPATLSGGIMSDLPGQVTAQVRQNVYDTVTGRYLLIPQGSKLIIIYDSNVAYGQERVLPAVKRIIFPNGQSMDLEGMPASDNSGYAGFHDKANNHYLKIYGAALATGGIAALFQMSQPQQNSAFANPTNTQVAAGAMGQQLAQTATMTMSKNLNIQPTLQIRPGYQFNVNVTADMIFPQPYTD